MHKIKEKSNPSEQIGNSNPSFSIDQQDLPEAKDWQVGKKYKLEMEVEMLGVRKDDWMTKQPIMHSFKVCAIGVEDYDEPEEDQGKKGNK